MSKITRGFALAGACLAGLVVAAPANAQSLKLGVEVSRASAQAPTAVNAPVRVLSPGRNGGGASSTAEAGGGRGASVQAPIAVHAPIRVLSPGDDAPGAGGGADEGDGTEPAPAAPTVEAPVDVDAPIRILSPGDNGGGTEDDGGGTGDDGGGSGGGEAPANAGSEAPTSGDDTAVGALGTSTGGVECPVQAMSAAGYAGKPLFGAMSILVLALIGAAVLALRSTGRLPFARWIP
jgi:hypothetical protein